MSSECFALFLYFQYNSDVCQSQLLQKHQRHAGHETLTVGNLYYPINNSETDFSLFVFHDIKNIFSFKFPVHTVLFSTYV